MNRSGCSPSAAAATAETVLSCGTWRRERLVRYPEFTGTSGGNIGSVVTNELLLGGHCEPVCDVVEERLTPRGWRRLSLLSEVARGVTGVTGPDRGQGLHGNVNNSVRAKGQVLEPEVKMMMMKEDEEEGDSLRREFV
ncbi:hypothetical protein F2P81_017701 [Scophthalmus maximus]|uniref:Uncharacterized protein n=1 Tax=Scophthalmus maximus TaxID=52904 RepID=A0A6A4SGE7_SCOMX|nr:hypothetical protein F2P81_017701 [Scophthalmus maximus]